MLDGGARATIQQGAACLCSISDSFTLAALLRSYLSPNVVNFPTNKCQGMGGLSR